MIKKETFSFIKEVKANNNRDWFKANKDKFDNAKSNFAEFVDELLLGVTKFDKRLSGVSSGECVFRIYRDVRFAKDKSPYKTNLGAAMAKGGRKSFLGGYYFHIEPGGNSFLAGGSYMPAGDLLSAIRQEIDYNSGEFKKIIQSKSFSKYFGDLSETHKLKMAPKGYPKDHPDIEVLKLKSYVVMHKVPDKEVLSKDFLKYALKVYKEMKPLNDFLVRATD